MARSPRFKVYSRSGEYMAACKYAEDAAAMAGLLGEGATIRYEHSLVIWREGEAEEEEAAYSFDKAADLMRKRIEAHYQKVRDAR